MEESYFSGSLFALEPHKGITCSLCGRLDLSGMVQTAESIRRQPFTIPHGRAPDAGLSSLSGCEWQEKGICPRRVPFPEKGNP